MQTSAHPPSAKKAPPAPGSSKALTLDRNALRDLWLPVEAEHHEACTRLWRLACAARRAGRTRNADALVVGFARAQEYHHEIVQMVRERGGLLHIGAPRALQ